MEIHHVSKTKLRPDGFQWAWWRPITFAMGKRARGRFTYSDGDVIVDEHQGGVDASEFSSRRHFFIYVQVAEALAVNFTEQAQAKIWTCTGGGRAGKRGSNVSLSVHLLLALRICLNFLSKLFVSKFIF